MELAYIRDAQMVPLFKVILVIPILMAVSEFLAQAREVKGQVVPMGGQIFKIRILNSDGRFEILAKKYKCKVSFIF